jgi:putative inorganic carbon (HCO3(-)) transporter
MGERAGVLALAALAPAAMLVVDPDGWYPFGPSKWLVIPTLLLAGAAMVLSERPVRVPRGIGRALVFLVGWLALAAVLGHDHLYAFVGTPERHFGVLTWALCGLALVVGCSLDPVRHGRLVVNGVLAAGLGVGAVATAEALGWEPRLLDVADRLSGPFGSPAYLGAATALLLPIAIGIALSVERGRRRPIAAATSGLLLVACLGSGARAAWVGLAVAAAVVTLAHAHTVRARLRARPVRAAAGIAGLVLVGIAVVVLTPVGSRLSSVTDPDAAGGRGRLDEWRVAAHVAEHHLLVGVGPEGYRTEFASGVDARYERTHGRRQQPDRAHSGPLDIVLAGGLPALAGWAVVVALVGRSVWAALRSGPAWLQGVAAGLVAHVVGQLLLFPVVELEPVAWLLAGLVVAAAPTSRVPRAWTVGPVAVGALGVAAAVTLASGVTDVVADRRAEVATEALARGDFRAAARAATSAEGLRPDIVRLHLLAARATVADQQGLLTGLRHVNDALRVSPHDPIALLTRATLLVERAESTHTRAHIASATTEVQRLLANDPDDAALWRLLARSAALSGDAELVREATARATSLTPPDERR